MTAFLKRLQSDAMKPFITIALFVGIGMYLFNILPHGTTENLIRNIFQRGLIAFAVFALAMRKQLILGHVVLFLFGFTVAGAAFVNGIFAYSFRWNEFVWDYDVWWILNSVVFIYFVAYFASLFLTPPTLGLKYIQRREWVLVLLVFAYFTLRIGFQTGFFMTAPVVLLLLRKEWFYGIVIMIATLIPTVISFFFDWSNNFLDWVNLSYYVWVIGAATLIVFLVLDAIPMLKEGHWRWHAEPAEPAQIETAKEEPKITE